MSPSWWSEPLESSLAGPAARLGPSKLVTVPIARPRRSARRPVPKAALSEPRRLQPAAISAMAGILTVGQLKVGPGGVVDLTRPLDDRAGFPQWLWESASKPTEPPRAAKVQSTDDEPPLWRRLAYLLRPRTELLLRPGGPLDWPGPLFDYQLEGVRALLSHDALLLGDDMGLGKTIQACAALRILVLQRLAEHSLFIVPAGLVSQWRQALASWAPELLVSTVRGPSVERAWQWRTPAHIYLTGYEIFREDCTANPQSPPRRRVWDLVLLDEAQRIKNPDAEVSRKCKLLPRRRAWALTGTPLENSLDDLASLLEFVTPLKEGERPELLFPGRALLERHRALQLRRRKADVLPQLPPKLVRHVSLPLTGPQRASYDRVEQQGVRALRDQGTAARIENVLELITRLKQICNVCPASGRSAKLDDLLERLATLTAEGHRALVFSQFTDPHYGVRALAERLRAFRPLLYTGDLTSQQRDEVLSRFKSDPTHRVLILSLRAGGQGLNLQEASYVFHFDRWWNPAVERQAEDRGHRLGQTLPVHVYAYTCEDTIEERIDTVLRGKQALFDQLIDDVSLDLRSTLTAGELFGLFGLHLANQA